MKEHFEHQPALDGLRALAVVLVIAFHLGLSWAGAGFIGVDLFFVLSGFLITRLLIYEQHASGVVALREFWVRRARRLLPAVLLLVPICLAISLLLPETRRSPTLAGDGLASLFYVANWRFVATGQNYFASLGAPSPFQHLWSLAVEEQWYLVWPIVVAVLLRRSRRALIVGVAAAAAASAVAFVVLAHPPGNLSRAYYGTDTRAQALLVGALAALLLGARAPAHSASPRWDVIGWGSFATLLAVTVTATESSRWLFRGGMTAVAVAGLGMVLAAERAPGRSFARVGSWAPLCFIGERAYALYLWHWPVVVFTQPGWLGLRGWWLMTARIAMTLGAAMISHHVVELPVRRVRVPRVALAGFASVALISSAVLVDAAFAQAPSVLSTTSLTVPMSLPSIDTVSPPTTVASSVAAANDPTPVSTSVTSRPPWRVLLVGDSTALVLGIAWDASLDPGTEVLGQATLGCGMADGVPMSKTGVIPTEKSCASWPDEWAAAAGRADPRVAIVMAGAWEVLDHRVNGQNVRFGTPRWDEVVQAAFDKAVSIAGAGYRPVALLTVPCFKQDLASAAWARDRNDPARVARANQLLRVVAAHHPNVTVVEYGGFVCPAGAYQNDVQGVSMRFDGVHLSTAGARATWQWLLPQLKALDPAYAP